MTNLISKHGGYKNLKSFQMAEIVYDLTFEFVKRYVAPFKQKEQMEGAARGGKQNIGEGSETSATSKESELRLVTVARASQGELKLDYEDYLRTQHLPIWDKNDARVLAIRQLAYLSNKSYKTYLSYLANPETAANCLLCLINQTCYLLDKQLNALSKDLVEYGDFKDRHKQIRKQKIIGQEENYEEFLKQNKLKRLENGRVVGLNDPG